MLRALCLALTALASPAFAACDGPSLMDRLTQAERTELAATVAATPFPEGLIWQAERAGKVVTLVGTMHIYDERMDAITDQVIPLLNDADLLMLEITPAEQARMVSALAADPSMVYLADEATLPGLLDDATWNAVSAAAEDRNIPPYIAARLQPWFLMLSLSVPACAMDMVADGKLGLDMILTDAAEAAGLPMLALEPWDTLFSITQTGTLDEQLDFLRMGVLDTQMQEQMFVATLDGYFAGETAEVWALSRIAMRYMPDLDQAEADALFAETEEMLLNLRNTAWIPVIEAATEQNDRIMVAAGAAHLPGENGVLVLLERQGWTITPLG